MSKVAKYLNEHLLGNVSGLSTLRDQYASDASVLSVTPELIVYPKTTNDIRKVARFSWQLAEKGHVLSLTPRGLGGDTTGGAIGSGLIIDTTRHLSSILYVATKEKSKFVHVQPGVRLSALHEALRWHGITLGAYSPDIRDMTVGGAIAGGVSTYRSGKYGTIANAIDRMEVVLANGDLMELGRINKREVSKKQGEQTLEGEIYRQLDGLLEENAELISTISSEHDNIGYRIDQVRHKDGSFDLTPLFIGSQGTLGVISEVVLKTDFYSDTESAVAIACATADEARDIADIINQQHPASLLLIDNAYYDAAHTHGKRFIFDKDEGRVFSTIIYTSFDDFNDKVRERKVKKLTKQLEKRNVTIYSSLDNKIDDLCAIRDVAETLESPLRSDETFAAIGDGSYVPVNQVSSFVEEVSVLAARHHASLPLKIDLLTGIISTGTTLHLSKISEKQKIFKLLTDYAALVAKFNGSIAGGQAEGRLGAFAGYAQLDPAVVELNAKIRAIFDPFGTLNPGVKQSSDLRVLARQLKS